MNQHLHTAPGNTEPPQDKAREDKPMFAERDWSRDRYEMTCRAYDWLKTQGHGDGYKFLLADFALAETRELTAQITTLREQLAVAMEGLRHYADSNWWACENSDRDHAGKCSQRLYIGKADSPGYDLAAITIASVTEGSER